MTHQTSNKQDLGARKPGYAPPTLTVLGSAVEKTRSSNEGNTQEPFSENICWTTQN